MDNIEKISNWITVQKQNGRSHEDLNGTIFVLSFNKAARISDAGDNLFDIEILLEPYAVDFTN